MLPYLHLLIELEDVLCSDGQQQVSSLPPFGLQGSHARMHAHRLSIRQEACQRLIMTGREG